MAIYPNRNGCFGLARVLIVGGVISLIGGLAIAFPGKRAIAQIVPDATLGAEGSVITPNVNVRGLPADLIEGGAPRGANLFHSFSEFNVSDGFRVYFANPTGIENIFSRVTGGNLSNIFGTLGVDGAANLFLLNPNGIIFGPNAQLDIAGSFSASTANSLVFDNGVHFSATNPEAPALLTINVPVGLQYGSNHPGSITNEGNLTVGRGQSLTLSGGDVSSTGSLTAPGGTVMVLGERVGLQEQAQIDVASDTGGGTVLIGGDYQGNGTVPNALRTFVGPDVTINADANTNGDGGRVIVWADEVTGFYGNISARGGSESGNGGFVEVSGKQDLIFQGTVDTSAINGSFGSLLLDPTDIIIVSGGPAPDDGQLADNQILQGDGGAIPFTISETALEALAGDTNVILQATNNITINDLVDNSLDFALGTGAITFTADADSDGIGSFGMQDTLDAIRTNGRNLAISATSLSLGTIDTSPNRAEANGGDIQLTASSEDITATHLTSSSYVPDNFDTPTNTANSGSIQVSAPNGGVNVTSGILSSSQMDGQGGGNTGSSGSITIEALNDIFVGNAAPPQEPFGAINASTFTFRGNTGKASDVTVISTAGSISILGGIFTNTTAIYGGSGNDAGSITLRAANTIYVPSSIETVSRSPDGIAGNAGKIELAANEIVTGNLNSESTGAGNSGAINITSPVAISITDRQIISRALGNGNGGDIRIEAPSVTLTNTELTATTSGAGRSGNISVNATNEGDVLITALSNLTTTTTGTGDAGDITITGGSLSVTSGSELNASTSGQGNAGKIDIEDVQTVSLDNSTISTAVNAGAVGEGGSVEITAGSLSLDNNAQISSSTAGVGNTGQVSVQATDTISLSNNAQIRGTVEAGAIGDGNEINIQGRSLSLTNGAQVSASTSGQGRAGNIQVDVTDGVTISGTKTGLFASTENSIVTPPLAGVNVIEAGESGQLLDTAQDLTTGPAGTVVTSISGTLSSDNDVDLYEIFLAGDQTFSATTLDGATFDTELFLFTETGIGVYANDDAISGRLQSTLPAGDPLTPTAPGVYYLGISSYNNDPLSAEGNIFEFQGPTGPGGGSPLNSWNDTGTASGTYTINLTGIGATVPQVIEQPGGDGGNITVRTGSLAVTDGAQLAATTSGAGDAGNVTIEATGAVSFDGGSALTSVEAGSTGQGGNLDITARSLSLTNDASLSASTSGQGNAGQISIQAMDTISLSNNAQIRGAVEAGAIGDGNEINIQGRSLELTNEAQVVASTAGEGKAGNIEINMTDSVTLSGEKTGLFASTQDSIVPLAPVGITLTESNDAGQLLNTAQDSTTGAAGTAVTTISGTLSNNNDVDLYQIFLAGNQTFSATTVDVSDVYDTQLYLFDANGIGVYANDDAEGSGTYQSTLPAGNPLTPTASAIYYLAITTYDNAALSEGGEIFGDSFSTISATGPGGELPLSNWNNTGYGSGTYTINLTGTGTTVPQLLQQFGGDGGNITVQTGSLAVNDGAQLAATTSGTGDAGNVTIQATDTVSFARGSAFTSVEAGSMGQGGNLDIAARSLSLTDNASLSSSTSGQGNAGSITVRDAQTVSLDNSNISTAVNQGAMGSGGNVAITADSLVLDNNAQISSSTTGIGNTGEVSVQATETISLNNNSQIRSTVEAGAVGDSQEINLQTRSLSLTNGAQLSASTSGQGSAGSIFVEDAQTVALNNSTISTAVNSDAQGEGGNVEIATGLLTLDNNAKITSSTSGVGDTGEVSIQATDAIALANGSGIASTVEAGAVGNSQQINLQTRSLSLTNQAQVSASTSGQGNAGSIVVRDADSVFLSNSSISTESSVAGTAGDVTIDTQQMTLESGAEVSASTTISEGGDITLFDLENLQVSNSLISASTKTGTAGNLIVNASESVELKGTLADGTPAGLLAEATDGGDARSLTINTGELTISDGAQATVSSTGEGSAGNLEVTAEDVTLNNQARLTAETEDGGGGNISLSGLDTLEVTNSLISASTETGTAGSVTVDASESVKLEGTLADGTPGGLLAAATNGGDANSLSITTGEFTISDGAQATVSSTGEGSAGNLEVTADKVTLNNQGRLTAETEGGSGGNISLQGLDNLEVSNSLISASTQTGTAGSVTVNAADSVNLEGTLADGTPGGLLAAATNGGDANSLRITTGEFTISDGAQATVSSTGEGSAGNLEVAARDVRLNNQARLTAETEDGEGGNINLQISDSLETNNGLISASTETGIAGNVTITAGDSVRLRGAGGLSVEATNGGTAGDLSIKTGEMSVSEGAQVTVSSPDGQAGNLSIDANSLSLNRGRLIAETGASGDQGGANITLTGLDFLLLRNESLISANASGTANGGNINIDSQFIIAPPPQGPEGSDIVANAIFGNGGQVTITSQGILGIDFRSNRTPLNDITASSQAGQAGVVTLNTPNVDPSRGLGELPTNLVDATGLVDRSCVAGKRSAFNSSFIVTGRGGLPSNPTEPLNSDAVVTQWVTLDSLVEDLERAADDTNSTSSPPKPIVEAQGWVKTPDGQVILVAEAPTATPAQPWLTSPSCQAVQSSPY